MIGIRQIPMIAQVGVKSESWVDSYQRSSPPSWLSDADQNDHKRKIKFRSIWISDVHLGTAGCNATLLLDFLKSVQCEYLYLVGDIIDGWRLKKSWYWPSTHNDVVRQVMKMARKGVRVIYVPGNHDEMMRDYVGLKFGDIQICKDAMHITADGRKLWIVHGDEFDSVVLYARWLAFLGDRAYSLLLSLNVIFNAIRRKFGMPYWSLSSYLKTKVKNAVAYVSLFEEAVAHAAEDKGVDGIICGHIHYAEIRKIGNITYYNDGDWVESCTALVEKADGGLSILNWAHHKRAVENGEAILHEVFA